MCGSYRRGSQNDGGTQTDWMLQNGPLRKFLVHRHRCCPLFRVTSFWRRLISVKRTLRLLVIAPFTIGWKLTLNTYRHWLASAGSNLLIYVISCWVYICLEYILFHCVCSEYSYILFPIVFTVEQYLSSELQQSNPRWVCTLGDSASLFINNTENVLTSGKYCPVSW